MVFELVTYVDIVLYLDVNHLSELEKTTDNLVNFIKILPFKFRDRRVSLYFRIQSENGQ